MSDEEEVRSIDDEGALSVPAENLPEGTPEAPVREMRHPSKITAQEIYDDFKTPEGRASASDQAREAMDIVSNSLMNTMTAVAHEMPACRELSVVRTKLQEAMFWANHGIARHR